LPALLLQGTGQPNNNGGVYPAEYCAVARATLGYANAWGWDDEPCEAPHIIICKTRREFQPASLLLLLLLLLLLEFSNLCNVLHAADRHTCDINAQEMPGPTHVLCPCLATAPGSIPPINMTSSSGVVFSFNYWLRGTVDAQKHCNQQGGHLASYSSMLEQNEVEQAFIAGVRARGHVQPLSRCSRDESAASVQ
jgi:hypothetical protein